MCRTVCPPSVLLSRLAPASINKETRMVCKLRQASIKGVLDSESFALTSHPNLINSWAHLSCP
uniref:Uncharacterized protein n=1 Tax=Arcella intermedia TaxID=1963864 RepID=A0A6B2LW41_9EUKA